MERQKLIIQLLGGGMKKNDLKTLIDYSALDICADISQVMKQICENLAGFHEYTPKRAVKLTYKVLTKQYRKTLKNALKANRRRQAKSNSVYLKEVFKKLFKKRNRDKDLNSQELTN